MQFVLGDDKKWPSFSKSLCARESVTDLNMAIVDTRLWDCVCVCVTVYVCLPACLHLRVCVCLYVCVHTPLAFSQFSRTSLIQQEWKSFLHGVHRRQKEMERKTCGGVGVVVGPR